ncbi:regulator of G-protein signaling 3-like [Lytechinus variegatus]|uniref:regulator of G-protein signaling 3-like n=1 Tax=Lytechinus variegatus TaxID=7654 RepID=UPI001BB22971|nr:regulator of G-protein signaling 3-like [Lytechinus variegatus]
MASRSYYSLSTTHRNKGETRPRVVATAITTHQQPSATLQPKSSSSHGQQNYMKPDKRGQQQQDSKKYGYFSRSESVRRSGKRLAAKRCDTGDSEAAKLTGKLKILIKTKSSCFSIRVCGAKELKIPTRTPECRLYARISVVTRGKEILREFTSVQHDTREPKFDKTFYIPLELVQISSRLIIHLNRQTGKRFDDVIGCMSFGMKNMISSSKYKR